MQTILESNLYLSDRNTLLEIIITRIMMNDDSLDFDYYYRTGCGIIMIPLVGKPRLIECFFFLKARAVQNLTNR